MNFFFISNIGVEHPKSFPRPDNRRYNISSRPTYCRVRVPKDKDENTYLNKYLRLDGYTYEVKGLRNSVFFPV